MNTNSLNQNYMNVSYRITAFIKRLKLNKNSNFQCKILWKRNQNKIQTKTVTHSNNFSIFQEPLTLQFTMQYDKIKNVFVQKNTQILPIIVTENGLKSGGTSKLDLAQALNKNLIQIDKQVVLSKSPDPQAYVELKLSYEKLNDQFKPEQSTFGTQSSLNISRISMINQESRIIEQPKQNLKESSFNLNNKINEKKQKSQITDHKKRNEILESENIKLKKLVQTLENKVQFMQLKYSNEKKELEKKILNLQKVIDKKCKQLIDKNENTNNTYFKLYTSNQEKLEIKIKEVESLQKKVQEYENKLNQMHKNDSQIVFSQKMFNQQPDFAKEFAKDQSRIQILEKQNHELQEQLILISHKMAQLFNSALEIGGANLLDKMQSAIGLIE